MSVDLSDPKVWGSVAVGVFAVVGIAAVLLKKKCGCAPRRHAPGDKEEVIEIYVGNLSYDMNDDQLRREFERYGTVKSSRVIENRFSHKSKGFGFIEMIYRKEAEAAVKALHDKEVMGRRLRVNEAKNKSRD